MRKKTESKGERNKVEIQGKSPIEGQGESLGIVYYSGGI